MSIARCIRGFIIYNKPVIVESLEMEFAILPPELRFSLRPKPRQRIVRLGWMLVSLLSASALGFGAKPDDVRNVRDQAAHVRYANTDPGVAYVQQSVLSFTRISTRASKIPACAAPCLRRILPPSLPARPRPSPSLTTNPTSTSISSARESSLFQSDYKPVQAQQQFSRAPAGKDGILIDR